MHLFYKRRPDMKSFLLLVLLALAFPAGAQPATKLYAYSQVITPGIVRQHDIPAETGNHAERKPLAAVQYYIYAKMKTQAGVQFRQVWIKGQWYAIARTSNSKTPVTIETPSPKILVPVSKQKLVQIEPGDSLAITKKPFAALASMMKKAELILCYAWKGKLYYAALQSIPELEKAHAE